jgi:hypothetical protein
MDVMSIPVATANTPTITGAPGSYVLNYSWSGTNTPTSYTVSLYQVIQSVTTVATTLTGTVLTSSTYSNLVTGASYYSIVTATNGTGTSSPVTSSSVSFYNPFGGPQGVQGVQGIAGENGVQGPPGPQGLQGLQGVVNFSGPGAGNISNYLITTSGNPGTINANSGLTWNGTTLNVSGSSADGVITTSAGNNSIGGVTLFASEITAPGTTSSIGGVTLSNGALTGVTTISAGTGSSTIGGVTLSNGAISNAASNSNRIGGLVLQNSQINAVSGNITIQGNASQYTTMQGNGGMFQVTNSGAAYVIAASNTSINFNASNTNWYFTNLNVTPVVVLQVTSNGNISNSNATSNNIGGVTINSNAISGVTTLNTITIGASGNVSGMGTLGCGAITAPTATNTINGVIISNGVVSGVTTLNTITVGSTGNVSGMGTLGCSNITSSGTVIASTGGVEHRLGNVTFNSNTISWAGDGDTGFRFLSDGIFNVVNNNVVMAQFNTTGLDMQTKPISNVASINTITLSGSNVSGMGTLGCGAITASGSNLIGGVTLNASNIGTSGNISASGSNLIGGVTLNASNISTSGTMAASSTATHSLGRVNFSNGTITGALSLTLGIGSPLMRIVGNSISNNYGVGILIGPDTPVTNTAGPGGFTFITSGIIPLPVSSYIFTFSGNGTTGRGNYFLGGRNISNNLASIVQFSAWQSNGFYYTGTMYFNPATGAYINGYLFANTISGTGATQYLTTSNWSTSYDIYYTINSLFV